MAVNRPVMKRFSIVTTGPQHVVPENLPETARQPGVAHILEGSVQKSGDAVRVNAQLTKAANDSRQVRLPRSLHSGIECVSLGHVNQVEQ